MLIVSINIATVPFTGPMIAAFASAGVLKMFFGCIFPQLTCTTHLVFLSESSTKKIGTAGEISTGLALHQAHEKFQRKINKLFPQTNNQ